MHPFPCSFALLLLLLFADAHSENLIEQVILPVDQPFDNNNNNTLTTTDDTIGTEIIAAKYSFLMKLIVKTSGDDHDVHTYATLDTGSDFIWLNVKGCCGDACHCCSCETETKCIKKPKELIRCDDEYKRCDKLVKSLNIEKKCSPQEGLCMYDINKYADGFRTQGLLGKGKFSFPIIGKDQQPHVDLINFGVSEMSKGRLDHKSQGIVGLGRGSLSLLRQIPSMELKFSYCLPNPSSKTDGKFRFGKGVKTSPDFITGLLTKPKYCLNRYCVHLATISLNDGDEGKIPVSEANKVMVIDSGSTFTYLANGLFNVFLEKVTKVIGPEHEPKKVNEHYDNCFEDTAHSKEEKLEEKLKQLSFEFGGVDGSGTKKIKLKWENLFDRYTPPGEGKPSYLCLTVADRDKKENNHARLYEDIARENGNSNLPHLLGNRAQMDFLVAFDLKENKVSFVKKDSCGEKENLELSVLSE